MRDFTKSDGKADAKWREIGAGFIHKDGKGVDVVLDAVPVGGRIVLRMNTPQSEKE